MRNTSASFILFFSFPFLPTKFYSFPSPRLPLPSNRGRTICTTLKLEPFSIPKALRSTMHGLKERVSNQLSRLLPDSPTSPQIVMCRPDRVLVGGESKSSYFSFLPSPFSFFGSRSNNQQHDLRSIQSHQVKCSSKESQDQDEYSVIYLDCNTLCKNEEFYKSIEDDKKCSVVYDKEQTVVDGNNDRASGSSSSGSDTFEDAPDQHLCALMDESAFVSSELFDFFQSSLPNIVKGRQWVLLYSTMKHGISLRTLIRNSADLPGPCLLIAGDRQGAVFGGLLECPLQPTPKRKYQGTSQSFVFTTIHGEPRVFRPTGANRYYHMCLNDILAFGGGGNFALYLDGDLLSGSSGPCETFGNLCLAHSRDFELKNVELWGFAHASRFPVRQ